MSPSFFSGAELREAQLRSAYLDPGMCRGLTWTFDALSVQIQCFRSLSLSSAAGDAPLHSRTPAAPSRSLQLVRVRFALNNEQVQDTDSKPLSPLLLPGRLSGELGLPDFNRLFLSPLKAHSSALAD